MSHLVGYTWLQQRYSLAICQPLRVRSEIGTQRKDVEADGTVLQTFPSQYQPDPTLAGHLTFAFKREHIHLELLTRLFWSIEPQELIEWINAEPTGQYARKACFLYEWLTGQQLDHPGLQKGNYLLLLGEQDYLTSSQPVRNSRWRLLDNMPGTPAFCPMIRLNPALAELARYDPRQALEQLGVEFGQDTLLRSAVWLTIKESRSSFAIEHEQQQLDRIERFAAVMETRCGTGAAPLASAQLQALQAAILGPRALSHGLRKSPIFVGQTVGYQNVVNYLAPHWEQAVQMLEGLRQFEQKTKGRNSILRAAALSFGFVYIHPLSDGNGRISRFLVNDTLRRDNAIPAPYILPVSAVMQDHAFRPQNYDQILDAFSRPLMNAIRQDMSFGPQITYEDGVESNLRFEAFEQVAPAWRYIDMTLHAEYLARVIRNTVEKEMRDEASLLRNHYRTREAIKNIVEGPDHDIDRIIRAVHQTKGLIGNKLKKQYPILADEEVANGVVEAVERFLPWAGEQS